MTRARKYTDEQIVAILQEHQGGVTAKEIIRRHGIALDTFYRWKRKYASAAELVREPGGGEDRRLGAPAERTAALRAPRAATRAAR